MGNRDKALLAGAFLAGALFLAALLWRSRSGEVPTPQETPIPHVEVEPPAPAPAPPAEDPKPAAVSAPVELPAPAQTELNIEFPGRPDIPPDDDPTWDFTSADLEAAGQSVRLDFGDYSCRTGEEVEVRLVLDSPPLTSLVVAFRYDPNVIQYVDDSAHFVGEAFRRGIEFYAVPEKRTMALVSAGLPGQKNMLASTQAAVMSFRVRGVKPGTCRLTFVNKTVTFTTARGTNASYTLTGGLFVVGD